MVIVHPLLECGMRNYKPSIYNVPNEGDRYWLFEHMQTNVEETLAFGFSNKG